MSIKVDNSNFTDEVLKCNKPVLVDFFAVWCGPCSMIAPIIDELSKEKADKIKVCKLNVDEAKSIAIDYGVRSIPTLIFFKDGNIVNTIVGARSKAELAQIIDEL
ncbi:MAG: thioredoxin [Clostridia bacterium]